MAKYDGHSDDRINRRQSFRIAQPASAQSDEVAKEVDSVTKALSRHRKLACESKSAPDLIAPIVAFAGLIATGRRHRATTPEFVGSVLTRLVWQRQARITAIDV